MTYTLSRISALLLLATSLTVGTAAAQTPVSSVAPVTDSVMVQPGDTAYSLSRRAGLSIEAFLALNNLSTPDLKVGQMLTLRDTTAHVVQPGETLYALSRKYGVSVDALKAINTLPEDATISVGQTLKVPMGSARTANVAGPVQVVQATVSQTPVLSAPIAQTQATVSQTPAPDVSLPLTGNWRENALAMLGTPYVYGGTSRRGLDCSGFVLQVFTPLGVKLPRVSADQARAGVAVSTNDLQPGDLLFFDTVGGGKVTHVGIYLGNDTFVNANSYRGVVTVDHLGSDKYWATRFLSARRVMTDAMAAQP